MRDREIYPNILPEIHHFVNKAGGIYRLHYSNSVQTREIDFEEDEWRHDDHYVMEKGDKKKSVQLLVEAKALQDKEELTK